MLCHLQSISSGLRVIFKENKKDDLKLLQPERYHPLMSSIPNLHFCLICSLYQSIAQSSGPSLLFPVYNLTATLLDCVQTGDNAACC